MADLTAREREMLDFERTFWRHQGSKETAIRDRFDVSLTRYLQEVRTLSERTEALAYAPVVVNRLRRRREARRATGLRRAG